ncbi:hypothetical protein RCH09_002678 [Actimicrobium sp. GrIS 1.19]|uniref:hypothetical protein n=1 Tax=Actimicrobium sp. GrIS 1.19 TaxID=3071708 RepID=UPI002E0C68FD|nr:hypothetical protein [Actimicrobium sp. GrIS 1.19]
MKIKSIVAACVALCSASAFALPLDITSQAPELTFYIGGASAQKGGVSVVVPADLFATPADVIKVTEVAGQKTVGFYGMSLAKLTGGTSVRLYVAYNSTNGSAQGVNQLLSNAKNETESKIVTVGNAGCSAAVATAITATSPNGYASTCSTPSVDGVEVDMALADVYPGELVPGALVLAPVGGAVALSDLTIKPTAFQGFGVVVNSALYSALQTAQGLVGGSDTAANQPSITRADYASLISVQGSIKSAGQLLGNGDATNLTVVRRTDTSGTQASSNLFFANNYCGLQGRFGALTTVGAADAQYTGADPYMVTEEKGTGGVTDRLTTGKATAVAGYGIGVISLENPAVTTAGAWRYVKIDGVSPNFKADGTADTLNRNAFASGRYPFAFEMSAMYKTAAPAITQALAEKVITGLKDSTKHNLTGIAYLDGLTYAAGGKQSYVNRGGNNCQPAIN